MIGQARQWWGASRRRRRRVTWLALLVVVAGSAASLVVWERNTGPSYETPLHPGKIVYPKEPATVVLGAQALRAAQLATYTFLRTAVRREHVEDSYQLVAPSLRKGYSRSRWASGEIPVVPYPVDLKTVRYLVSYSYASGGPDGLPYVGLQVFMKPQKGREDVPAMRFGIELEAFGTGANRHWMVSQWGPEGQLGGEPQGGTRTAAPAEYPRKGQLSTLWLLVPVLLLGGIVLIPVSLGVRSWIRNRRIARTYSGI